MGRGRICRSDWGRIKGLFWVLGHCHDAGCSAGLQMRLMMCVWETVLWEREH